MSFVHIHTHSHYSMLDGLGKIDDLVAKAVEYNMPALALTDHGVMYGAVEFYQKAKKAGIKPIIGVEAYVARNKMSDKNTREDGKPYHLILLAKNEEGYKNIVKMTSIAHLEGFYYKPRIDWNVLKENAGGLICTTACLGGELSTLIINNDMEGAREMIKRYQDLFGKENFYLEVQYHPNLKHQMEVNEKIYELSKEMSAPVIATNDIHYVEKDDAEIQDILLCIQTKKVLSDTDRMSMMDSDFSFKSPAQMKEEFKEHPEVIENTLKIAEQCNFEMKLGEIVLPIFPLPEGRNEDEQLRFLCEEGLKKRFKPEEITDEYRERLDYELSIIQKTGYAGYFLITADFITWAKNEGIVVGPGRGSAAGSLVSYLIEITNLDPIQYDLVFERFLNPERISMPDIDTDFADARRDEVIQYAARKYGADKVAQIITFGTMAARASIRDVGRVMSLPYSYCDKVSKMIPMFTKLQKAIDTVPELQEVEAEEDGARLLRAAKRLEGVVRHASTHACGVVITPKSLDEYSPRQNGSGESIVIQYEGHSTEDLGLLKMDFLGLSNLSIIERALKIIKAIHGTEIDMDNIPLDDEDAYKLFQAGRTTGVFQLESGGMKRYLKQLAPTDIEDIVAMVALYRPGPMEYIPAYIDGKHGRITPTYLHPKLEPILGKTYGVAVYQEQLLQIARDLAGFSYGEADVLRKAVGKKIKELLDQQAIKLKDGMVKNGIDKKVADQIWEFILPFASYGFNRSHAACYALIAYQTAYLKAKYPAAFMAALMTADEGNMDRIAIEADECRQMGMEVLPPDINESFANFAVVAESLKTDTPRIRFGLMAVKSLGENIVNVAIEERKQNGKFKDLEDFLKRVKTKDLNKRSIEALARSGCLDCFEDRNKILHNMDRILQFVTESNQLADSGQNNLFAMIGNEEMQKLHLEDVEETDKRQKLTWEKEYLGLYVSEHPMSIFQDKVKGMVTECKDLTSLKNEASVRVAGVISSIKKIQTKKGDNMLFVKLEDTTGDTEILVFPKILEQNPNIWAEDNIVMISGTISDKDDEIKVLGDFAAILNEEDITDTLSTFLLTRSSNNNRKWQKKNNNGGSQPTIQTKYISINISEPLDYDISQKIKTIVNDNPGNYGLALVVERLSGEKQKIKTSLRMNFNDDIKNGLVELIGDDNVVLD